MHLSHLYLIHHLCCSLRLACLFVELGTSPEFLSVADLTACSVAQVIGAGQEWHKMCFKCMADGCNKILDSTTVADREGKIYCKACYAKTFGPKVC